MSNTTIEKTDLYTRHVRFDGEGGDVYSFELLPTRKASIGFMKAINLLAPLMSVSFDSWGDYMEELEAFKLEDLEGVSQEEVPRPSFFDISVVLGQQLDNPVFHDLTDMLLKDLKCNGKEVNLEDSHLPLNQYLKLVEYAFMENFKEPFMKWLEEKGLSGITTYLREAAKSVRDTIGV